ncbi:hypothetical protein BOTBODRAFT_116551 [Botryobasidium botryosum FD-172 SS1]|uniref:Ribosome assembly protein 1 n=1 Tax=Botryobasidium botryosum (strain FD-172 SS1) TaxID=930990 RepID=A0A067M5C5_BOTB1|nr:hypothetical protein BOTBODRAFT_116551 [Botryobasidium botryosum FD-172 SS1]
MSTFLITTMGHVDHGKTTFVDSLLAANNIISTRMAGKIRYLDSREDEQERGITMESSAISLKFKMMRKLPDGGSAANDFVINLIDTPGHVDFSSEVSTASRLCDGTLVLVDVVEGVCTQTIAVLRQAWIDRLKPILVINKVDRLVTELKLAPVEAYHHLSQLIEQVNAVMGSFFAGERMEDDLRWREDRERRLAEKKERGAEEAEDSANAAEDNDAFQDKDDEDIYFAPERGNIIFASAIDGWAFRVGKFAELYAAKLGIREANLRRVLWGDFYLDPKTKRVISHKHLKGRNLKPLFVQFVLENIWAVYENVLVNPNPEKVGKIVSALNIKIPPRDLKSKDTRQLLSQIFSQWLSLSTCTFQAVVEIIPTPHMAQPTRMPKVLYPDVHDEVVEPKNKLDRDLFSCNDAEDSYVVAYVSKMFAVPTVQLPQNKRKPVTAEEMRARAKRDAETATAAGTLVAETEALDIKDPLVSPEPSSTPAPANDDEETLIGFARLYSGTLRANTTIHCLLPKYNAALGPSHPRNARYIQATTITALYVMMGRDLVAVDVVKAGNVFAVGGLEGKILRNGTLCSPRAAGLDLSQVPVADHGYLVNLAGVNQQSAPIVRVALEPQEPADLPKLLQGLRLLCQSDPCVESFQQKTGEYVILTAGELHLERCLKDLRERFAKIEISVSKPIVPFRETAVKAPDMAPPKTAGAPRGTIHGASAHSAVKFTIRAVPLPESVTEFLQANVSIVKRMYNHENRLHGPKSSRNEEEEGGDITGGDVAHKPTVRLEDFWPALEKLLVEAGGEWAGVVDRIWAFGPNRVGPNILVDRTTTLNNSCVILRKRLAGQAQKKGENGALTRAFVEFEDNVETGFQIATFQGPLCAEPVQGMAYFVEAIDVDKEKIESENLHLKMAQVTGSLYSAVKDTCRAGLLDWSPRLMLAMYTCDIQASTEVLGKVYAVVAKRRGRIVSEEMKEGTSFFTIRALLPVVESFGFGDEIRKRTSGAASPQLIFSGYEMLNQDPFWVPTTEEELEDLGEKADRANVARGYMDAVRKRKGMFVEEKIVQFAEKQRTLKK